MIETSGHAPAIGRRAVWKGNRRNIFHPRRSQIGRWQVGRMWSPADVTSHVGPTCLPTSWKLVSVSKAGIILHTWFNGESAATCHRSQPLCVCLCVCCVQFINNILSRRTAERKSSRNGKAPSSFALISCLFGNVMTTKAAPARPPHGVRTCVHPCKCRRRLKRKMSSGCNWWESGGGDGGQEIITPLCKASRRGRSEE